MHTHDYCIAFHHMAHPGGGSCITLLVDRLLPDDPLHEKMFFRTWRISLKGTSKLSDQLCACLFVLQ
jgi:hypothetical protein